MDTIQESTESDEEEISLIDLLAVLIQHRLLIIFVCAATAAVLISVCAASLLMPPEKSFMPNRYTSSAHILINSTDTSGGSSLALAQLSSLTGINMNRSGSTDPASLASYLIGSDSFLDAVNEEFGFSERYGITEHVRTHTRMALKKNLRAEADSKSAVFTVSFTDRDPELCRQVAQFSLGLLQSRFDELELDSDKITKENLEKNIAASYADILSLQKQLGELGVSVSGGVSAYSGPAIAPSVAKLQLELSTKTAVYEQLRIQYEQLKIQMASKTPVFQVLDYPDTSDIKSGPSRGKLCIIGEFAAFFIAVFLAFALNACKNIRQDPEAWNKLFPPKTKEADRQ